jgi:methionyl-tRNA formyltransferase
MPIIGNEVAGLQKAISSFQPDVACIACFPLRLPEKILASVELGFLNLHPSLLPSHRGPVPLFWIFRSANQEASGVTVHRVDEGLDTGDIILQKGVEFTSGISGFAAERICGEIGGTLLAKAITGLRSGTLEPYPQPPGGSYDPWPNASDFRLSTSWSAPRAYNFMRGTTHWKHSYAINVDEVTIELKEALSCKSDSWVAGESTKSGDNVFIQFKSGILEARRM